jgi:DNA-binding LacI/PurR family transcriptional regulator
VEIPRRYSLATQAAASIRTDILAGHWMESLPSERNLCQLLQVSRPTLRAAIGILSHEGLVQVRLRRKTLIVPSGISRHISDTGVVVLLTANPLREQAADMLSFVGALHQTLARSNLRLVIVENPHLGKSKPRKFLETVIRQHKANCYVLMRVSEAVQVYFSHLRLPTFIRGSRFPKVHLPSSEWDYLAIGRHAAGVLAAKGHRRVVIILPGEVRPGDLRCEEGFRLGMARVGDGACTTLVSPGRATRLYRKILKMFREKDPPTAVFVLGAQDCVTVLFALENLGLRVPGEVSVMSCETAAVFQALPFRVASYSVHNQLIEKSAKLVMKLALNRFVPPHESLIMPEFDSGETLGRCPSTG